MVGRVRTRRPGRIVFPEQGLLAPGTALAQQGRDLADAVGRIGWRQFHTGDFAKSGEQIDRRDEGGIVDLSGRDLARPTSNERDADTALEERGLVALSPAGGSFGRSDSKTGAGGRIVRQFGFGGRGGPGRPVVRAEDDEGVVGQAQTIQRAQHFPDPLVCMRQDRRVDVVGLFKIAETPAVLRQHMKGRVRFVNPQVDEEGLSLTMALLDERDRVARVFMHRHLLAGTIESAVGIVAVFARQRRVRNHVVGEVPLAEVGGGVPALFQKPRQQRSLRVQPIGHVPPLVAGDPGEVSVDVVAGGEVACHHGGAARRTNPAGDGEAMEISALGRQPVDIRRLDIRMPVTAKIAPAPVIGKDEEDVRFSSRSGVPETPGRAQPAPDNRRGCRRQTRLPSGNLFCLSSYRSLPSIIILPKPYVQ